MIDNDCKSSNRVMFCLQNMLRHSMVLRKWRKTHSLEEMERRRCNLAWIHFLPLMINRFTHIFMSILCCLTEMRGAVQQLHNTCFLSESLSIHCERWRGVVGEAHSETECSVTVKRLTLQSHTFLKEEKKERSLCKQVIAVSNSGIICVL